MAIKQGLWDWGCHKVPVSDYPGPQCACDPPPPRPRPHQPTHTHVSPAPISYLHHVKALNAGTPHGEKVAQVQAAVQPMLVTGRALPCGLPCSVPPFEPLQQRLHVDGWAEHRLEVLADKTWLNQGEG